MLKDVISRLGCIVVLSTNYCNLFMLLALLTY
jgi:hypothetical protein